MLKPVNGNVIVKEVVKTDGKILTPPSAIEKPELGEVVASDSKDFKEGQMVYYKKWGGNEIHVDQDKFMVIDPKDILAIE